jgi:hypothetical protein
MEEVIKNLRAAPWIGTRGPNSTVTGDAESTVTSQGDSTATIEGKTDSARTEESQRATCSGGDKEAVA